MQKNWYTVKLNTKSILVISGEQNQRTNKQTTPNINAYGIVFYWGLYKCFLSLCLFIIMVIQVTYCMSTLDRDVLFDLRMAQYTLSTNHQHKSTLIFIVLSYV